MAPDMALFLGPLTCHDTPVYNVLELLLTHKETTTHYTPEGRLPRTLSCDWLQEPFSATEMLTTAMDRLPCPKRTQFRSLSPLSRSLYHNVAAQRLRRGFRLPRQGRAVITDRLHAHILCTLLRIPHFILDNIYGKIHHFRVSWRTGETLCEMASSLQDARKQAEQMLASLSATTPP